MMLKVVVICILYSFFFILWSKDVLCVGSDDFSVDVKLLGGKYCMGSLFVDKKCGELFVKIVGVKLFVIDKYFVINENFWKFVCVKKFKIEVESFGWSFVFCIFVLEEVRLKII